MFAGMGALVGSFFPSAEAAIATQPLSAEQRTFLSHFQTAFARLMADHAATGGEALALPPGVSPAALMAGLAEGMPAQTAATAEQELVTATAERQQQQQPEGQHNAAAAEQQQQGQHPVAEPTEDADDSKQQQAPTPAADAAKAQLSAKPPACEAGSDAAMRRQQALYVGQLVLSLAAAYPAIGASVSSLISMAQASGGGAADLPPRAVQELQASLTLPLAPLVAAQAAVVRTSLGEVLAARVAGAAPRGSPFASAAGGGGEVQGPRGTPVKAGIEPRGLETTTPVSGHTSRPAACKEEAPAAQQQQQQGGQEALASLALLAEASMDVEA